MAHVAEYKKDIVNELQGIIRDHSTIAVVKIDRIPGVQMQNIRAKLRDQMTIKVAKKNLIKIAFEGMKGEKAGIEKLGDHMDGQTAVLGTNLNPFTLHKILSQNIQPMPAKGGDEAPEDITVPAGETSFPPGPIVGEFGKAGIPAAIDKGKVIIRKTVTPVKKGGTISKEVAFALTKLGIFPFRVGIELDGAWEDGIIYQTRDLDIDFDAYRSQMNYGIQMAFNLAVFTAYATPLTAVPILQKARIEAYNLAVFAGIMNKDTADLILSKAYGGMLALARLMSNEALDNDLQGIIEGAAAAHQEATTAAPEDKKVEESKEKETEEEAPTEEDGMAGLGALFG
ncbi:MAG: 50S ribosomal protein L10 [Candidatus Thermoplasmatota archaeon]|nr:50S ribosomal protein L10 [Candidatus Thermoplasmatota archaeon]